MRFTVAVRSALVTTEWLASRLANRTATPKLRILDGSLDLMGANRDVRKDFEKFHIPSAQFFDVKKCRDTTSPYSYMLPKPQDFATYVGNLGISNDTHVVVYDHYEMMMCAARVWWMFNVFGHRAVSVLNGGLRKWMTDGHQVTDKVEDVQAVKFEACYNEKLVKSFDDVVTNIEKKSFGIVDTRGARAFQAHIPGAVNVPYVSMSDEEGLMKSEEELRALFKESNVDFSKPIVSSCGGGITACIFALGADVCGHKNIPVYDGSWSEWSQRAGPHLIEMTK